MEEKQYLHKWCEKLTVELTREGDHGCRLARVFLEDLLTECVMYPSIGFVDPYYVNYGKFETIFYYNTRLDVTSFRS